MSTVLQKFVATRKELNDGMVDRGEEIDVALTAMIAKENVLFVGDPGTGKSMLSDAIAGWVAGVRFNLQVNRYTTPEEMFGPLSITDLKNDRFRRVLDGRLATADVAFIDEVFKGSTAILNSMLQVLNERTFVNDAVTIQCPLKLAVGASNEWPNNQEGGKELGALFDRFLFRKKVLPVTDRGRDRLLWDSNLGPKLSTKLTPVELQQAIDEAAALPWKDEAKVSFKAILHTARQEGIFPGDRRMRKSVRACQAFAWLDGSPEVSPDHLEILSHLLWEDPTEQPDVLAGIVRTVAAPANAEANELLKQADEAFGAVDPKNKVAVMQAIEKLADIRDKIEKLSGSRAKTVGDAVAGMRAQLGNMIKHLLI